MNRHKFKELVDALLEGELSEAEFLELEAELTVDPELRREYLDRIALTTLLEAEANAEVIEPDERPSVSPSNDKGAWLRFAIGVTVICATAAGFMLSPNLFPPDDSKTLQASSTEDEAAGYGVISGQDDVVWTDQQARSTGSLIPTGTLSLANGVVQMELFSGVSVVVEGPAEFAVSSPMHMTIQSGKLRAHVPEPAHGFRVTTRDGDIVDLGTDFAVDVGNTQSELHVLDGEVELHGSARNSKSKVRRLTKGQALSITDGVVSTVQADSQRFVGQDEIVDRLKDARKNRREEWLSWSKQLRQDPRLIALYQVGLEPNASSTTDAEWRANRRIRNQATNTSTGQEQPRELASEGAVVAAARTTDRWQHRDGALDFSPTGSRVRLTVPGQYGALTLMCWVKINSLDRWYNSLFLTDGHERHEPHWQIMDDGRLFFSVKKRDQWDRSKGERDKHIYYSPPFWDNSLSGQWLMIATVYDVDQRCVTHYVNGQMISEEAIPSEYLVEQVSIGNASVCNWSQPERDDPKFAVRNLNGSLDEFAMFSTALSREEIQEMYDRGKP